MDVDADLTSSIPAAGAIAGVGGGTMTILTPPITQSDLDKLIDPHIVDVTGDHTAINFDSIPSIVADSMDVDMDIDPSEPSSVILVGPVGNTMAILLDRPIRNRLHDIIESGLVADNTKAQFVEIADIIATGMDVDTDLPCGASGAWGALQTRSGELLNGIIHWSFDQFATELKNQVDDEIEYISGAGIPPYVVSGTDDPDAGIAGRDAEDFRFYDGAGGLRIQQMALPNQWNEINYQQGYGGGSSMKILMAMML